MFAKLSIVLAVAAVALSLEYPAGVHPAVCPNYPYCDAAMLARYTVDGLPVPEWAYNPYVLPAAPIAPPPAPLVLAEPALKYPLGVHPAVCPNYPYCDTVMLARYTIDGQPIPEWVYNPSILPKAPEVPEVPVVAPVEPTLAPVAPAAPADKYPADFDPALCPNYPTCE